jgi:tRNA-dihydrouridine synthase B
LIAREHGARFCFFEMLDSNSLTHNRRQSSAILKTDKKDSPIAGQLLGSDPSAMLDAAGKVLDKVKLSFLDINCACPVKKVIKKKAGAHLLRDAPRLYAVLKKLTSSLPLPITIKIRIGYDTKDLRHIVTLVKHCEELGIAAIFVHGRLAKQGYAGNIDYDFIKKIKEAVHIPVFGSGNIFSPEMAKKMFDETGCDGILVARGALGNPWIFTQIEDYLKNGKIQDVITIEEKKKVLKKQLAYIDKYREASQFGKVGFMKKVSIWYLKSIPLASRLRERIVSAKTYEGILSTISSID